jgi:hypothetical protein
MLGLKTLYFASILAPTVCAAAPRIRTCHSETRIRKLYSGKVFYGLCHRLRAPRMSTLLALERTRIQQAVQQQRECIIGTKYWWSWFKPTQIKTEETSQIPVLLRVETLYESLQIVSLDLAQFYSLFTKHFILVQLQQTKRKVMFSIGRININTILNIPHDSSVWLGIRFNVVGITRSRSH